MIDSNISASSIDGVKRHPENGINVVVIGAGVAGLQAAIECWRKGCDVTVLEKAEELSPLGDFFTITPSALTTLKDYPSMHVDYHKCIYDCTTHVYTPSGQEIYSTVPEWKRTNTPHSAPDVNISFLKRRPVYARMQLDQAERLNIPILYNDGVVSVSEYDSFVIVKTKSGKEYTCDVCIGADGIGSKISGFNTGPEITVQDSGYAVSRLAFPRSSIRDGSPASSLLKNIGQRPQFRVYVGSDIHLILFLTPDYVAFCFTHPDYSDAKESWSNLKDPSDLIPYLEKANGEWDPAVLDFIRQAPAGVVDWKLRWRDGSPQWTSDRGRLVRLGDSAHAFLPTAGNGAVQGIEDAISLAECLRIGGKKGVCHATKVHNNLRFERVSILQQTGFLNREELHNVDLEPKNGSTDKSKIGFFKIGRWVWGHDPEAYARDSYESCLEHLLHGTRFENTNIPLGHTYVPWTLESERKRMQAGTKSNLKQNGDWSA